MRSIVVAALWLVGAFGATEFVADYLETWQTQRSPMVAEAAEPFVPPTFHVSAPVNHRPAPRPAPQPTAGQQ